MTRPARIAVVIGALVAAQAAAVLGYRCVEERRAPRPAFATTPLAGAPAPALAIERLDGPSADAAGPGRVRLVHFWATWCEPCRDELPTLLARAAQVPEVELIAVSVDDDWDAIRRFFPAGVPPAIVRARDRDAHRRFGAQALPDSYVLAPDGALVERLTGARDWSTPAAGRYLDGLGRRWKPSRPAAAPPAAGSRP